MSKGATFERAELVWRHGIGFLDPGPNPAALYSLAYWHEYAERAQTKMGRTLTAKRVQLVNRHAGDAIVCDVGIGCGAFVEARGANTFGFDVNPTAVHWLRERRLWLDPHHTAVPAVTFWDSMEHILDPGSILRNVSKLAFVAMPIYTDRDHCLRSKHFKPGEHVWYFSREGFVRFMDLHDFDLVERDDVETRLGRESVETFVFRRAE